jgi:photosystem II stability/assembly factor-like uncharacterized protein
VRALLQLALCAGLSLSPAAAVEWRQAALWGGDVRSLAIDPARPERIFAGTSSGQVLASENGGADWAAAGLPVAFPGWVVSDLLLDPEGRLWAALWGLWGTGGNVYMSADGGITWAERAEGLPGTQVYRLAAGNGRLFAATRRGVYGSDDDGTNWVHLTGAHPEIEKVSSLLVDGATVLAGTWRRAYKSEDGGTSWRGVFAGMVLDSEVFSLQPGPSAGEVWASTCGWVYRSLDHGVSWRRYQQGMDERRTQAIRVLPNGRLLAGTVAGLYVSDDGGASWSRRTTPELVVATIAHTANRPRRVYLGTEGSGVWVSDDGGDSFRPSNQGLTAARVADLVPLASGELLAAVRHAGPDSGVFSSRDGGLSFTGPGSEMPTVVQLAAAADRPLAATEKGLYERQYGEWRLVSEVGQRRIDQVGSNGGLTVARSGGLLFRRAGERFVPIEAAGAEPRSVAVVGGDLWIGDGAERLWRLAGGVAEPEPPPFAGGRLGSLNRGLLLAGDGGAYLRLDAASPWQPLLAAPSRGLPTGDEAYPLFLLPVGDSARLLERDNLLLHRVSLPVPRQDVTAVAVVGGRLLVATAGHGVVWTGLDDLMDQGAEPWARLSSAR